MEEVMKVTRLTEKEVPGLGDRIRAAREADTRSLTTLCKLVGMTPMNWYRIEKEEAKSLPEETLRRIESVLGVDFGVDF